MTAAVEDALQGGAALDKVALHQAMRERVRDELLPWCKGCGSHHVAPMLWRYATVKAGARLDAERRYVAGKPGRAPRRARGRPAVPALLRPVHAGGLRRLGRARQAARQAAVGRGRGRPRRSRTAHGSVLQRGRRRRSSRRPRPRGVRFLPPGDPYLQKANRPLLAPDADLRKQLFRPVASPGAVLKDGRLVGLWRAKAKGKKSEVTVEKLARFKRADVEDEAQRVAHLRGAAEATIVLV